MIYFIYLLPVYLEPLFPKFDVQYLSHVLCGEPDYIPFQLVNMLYFLNQVPACRSQDYLMGFPFSMCVLLLKRIICMVVLLLNLLIFNIPLWDPTRCLCTQYMIQPVIGLYPLHIHGGKFLTPIFLIVTSTRQLVPINWHVSPSIWTNHLHYYQSINLIFYA